MLDLDAREAPAPHPLRKAGYAVAATIIISLPLLLSLNAKPVPDRREFKIEPPEAGEASSVKFPAEQETGDMRLHEAWLTTPAPAVLMTHAEVQLSFSHSDHAFPHPVEGHLEVAGTPCRFEIVGGAHVADRRPLRFIRGDRCGREGSPSGELKLTMRMGGPGKLGIYTRPLSEAYRSAAAIYLTSEGGTPGGDWPVLSGVFVDEAQSSPLRRANLLSYVWTTQTNAAPVWTFTFAALLLISAGLWCFPFKEANLSVDRKRRFAAGAGVGAAAIAFGLACLYGLITPPFQAADESHHFASFADVARRGPVIAEGKAWAATAHNARITRRQLERFRPQDVGHPQSETDGFEIHLTFARSSLTARVWQVFGRVMPPMSAKRTFTIIRLFYAMVFALAVGASAALLAAYGGGPYPQLLVYPFLLVPALPYFGMHFGESALVTSISVVFAAITALVVVDGVRFRGFGLLLGLLAAVLVVGARNSVPMLPMVATLLLLRIVGLMRRDGEADSAAQFWGGFAIGASTYAIVLTEPHREALLGVLAAASSRVPAAGGVIARMVTPLFPFAAALVCCLLERSLDRPIRWIAGVVRRPLRAAALVLPSLLIVLIVISFVGSLYWSYPVVESIQGEGRASLRGYFTQVAATTATSLRWTNPSMLMSSSFWTGFGWLDTMPPYQFISVLMTLTGLSLIGLMVHLIRQRDVRLFATLIIIVIGSIVTLAGYVYSSYATLTNLHGRYLVGWNLVALSVCWIWPAIAGTPKAAARRGWPSRVTWLLVTAGLIHTYAARFVLQRYF